MAYLRRILGKETTHWSKTRKIVFLFLESQLKTALDMILIAIYLIMSTIIDLDTQESRSSAPIAISKTSYLAFMYTQNAWFFSILILGFISKDFKSKLEAKYLNSILNLLDIVIAICFFASPKLLGFLSVFRIFKFIGCLMEMDQFEFLKEFITLIRQTFLTIVSIIGVMIVCILFLSMLLNSIAVEHYNQQNGEEDLARCRYLTPQGKYKIDQSQAFLCSTSDPSLACKPGNLCLHNRSPQIIDIGKHRGKGQASTTQTSCRVW